MIDPHMKVMKFIEELDRIWRREPIKDESFFVVGEQVCEYEEKVPVLLRRWKEEVSLRFLSQRNLFFFFYFLCVFQFERASELRIQRGYFLCGTVTRFIDYGGPSPFKNKIKS